MMPQAQPEPKLGPNVNLGQFGEKRLQVYND